jgi:hypothetical protein
MGGDAEWKKKPWECFDGTAWLTLQASYLVASENYLCVWVQQRTLDVPRLAQPIDGRQ